MLSLKLFTVESLVGKMVSDTGVWLCTGILIHSAIKLFFTILYLCTTFPFKVAVHCSAVVLLAPVVNIELLIKTLSITTAGANI